MRIQELLAIMVFFFGLLLVDIGAELATVTDIQLSYFLGTPRLEKAYPYQGFAAALIFFGLLIAAGSLWWMYESMHQVNSEQTLVNSQ